MAGSQQAVVTGMPGNLAGVIGGMTPEILRSVDAFIFNFPAINPLSNFTRFAPPSAADTPSTLFTPRIPKSTIPAPRFSRLSNPQEFLI
jgi:hypothetical protein